MIAEAQGHLLFGYFLGIRDTSRSGSFGKKPRPRLHKVQSQVLPFHTKSLRKHQALF